MYVTLAGSTLQGTTVCVAEQMVLPTCIEGVVVTFQPGSSSSSSGSSSSSSSVDVTACNASYQSAGDPVGWLVDWVGGWVGGAKREGLQHCIRHLDLMLLNPLSFAA